MKDLKCNCQGQINYQIGEVFSSKEELFKNFFTDFYKYLHEYYPDSIKEYPLGEFLNIARDWKYGKGSMTGLANLFHPYYIVFEEDGIVENQTDKGFIGYCYQRNKYRSFIKFIITFFAYWRTDEDYSSSDVHGNDFFYNSWASLVDTCKFFYLTYDTLFGYQRTKRLLNCFIEIDSVVDVSSLPTEAVDSILPELTRRGYIFEGWYIDKDYQRKVTALTKDMAKINLYAKWEKASYYVTYKNTNGDTIKVEQYLYQDYVNIDEKYPYTDIVENHDTKRILDFSKEMPIINDIILNKK